MQRPEAGADLVGPKHSKKASTVGRGCGEKQEDGVREVSWVVAGGNLLDHIEPLRKSAVTCIGLA